MFFAAFVLCILIKLKTKGQAIYTKPHCKVTNWAQIKILAGLA